MVVPHRRNTMSKKVEGKIALITDGSACIGLATAKQFVDEGAFVYITGRREHQLADAVASIGSKITAIQGDVAKIADQKALPLMPDDPHPFTLDHGPAIDRGISVDARTGLEGFPPSSGRAGRGLKTTVAFGAVIVAAGMGLWAYYSFTATPGRPAGVPPPRLAP